MHPVIICGFLTRLSQPITKIRYVSTHPPSRCTIACGGVPYDWKDYCKGSERVAENELDALLPDGCTSQAQLDFRVGEVEALHERASLGELEIKGQGDNPEIKPVKTHPTLWELRWNFDGRPFRQYHAEPGSHPRLLLGLLYHWKTIEGTDVEIKKAQQAKMDEAAERLRNWHWS